jgi:hypothetical protein
MRASQLLQIRQSAKCVPLANLLEWMSAIAWLTSSYDKAVQRYPMKPGYAQRLVATNHPRAQRRSGFCRYLSESRLVMGL